MHYEWDSEKSAVDLRKHGVGFADAVAVFEDERALSREDTHAYGEYRFVTLGQDGFGRLLVVVYTLRGDTFRIISARKATAREIQVYERNR
jgi:uncharacterized DUF497 family protein